MYRPRFKAPTDIRRGGRVVECTALEMRHTCKGIVGSNPTLSAFYLINQYFFDFTSVLSFRQNYLFPV